MVIVVLGGISQQPGANETLVPVTCAWVNICVPVQLSWQEAPCAFTSQGFITNTMNKKANLLAFSFSKL